MYGSACTGSVIAGGLLVTFDEIVEGCTAAVWLGVCIHFDAEVGPTDSPPFAYHVEEGK